MRGFINIGTQPIKTERLLLRQITLNDADAVFDIMSDPEVCRYERWTPHESIEYSRGFICEVYDYSKADTYQWGIEFGGELAGSVSIVSINEFDSKAVMGYSVARKHWSKGIATEAVRAVLEFMFTRAGINRIEASHSVNNPASGRVLEKAGMKLEGFCKEYYFCNSGFQDSRIFALTRTEFAANEAGK